MLLDLSMDMLINACPGTRERYFMIRIIIT
jgi:hypothetical protein